MSLTSSFRAHLLASAWNWPLLEKLAFWLAVLIHLGEEVIMTRYSADSLVAIASAVSLRDGHGISSITAHWQDLGRLQYTALSVWPPGYAWLLALLWRAPLTESHLLQALWAMHLGGLLLLLGSWWYMLRLLRPTLQPWATAVFFGFWALSNTPFYQLHHTDLPSLALCSAGIACLLYAVAAAQARHRAGWWVVGAVGFSFAACLFRFAYYSLVFLPALTLIGLWWRHPVRRLALRAFLLTAALVSALVAYQHYLAGDGYYLTAFYQDPAWAIHWPNLLKFEAFVFHSVLAEGLANYFLPGTGFYTTIVLLVSSMVAWAVSSGFYREVKLAAPPADAAQQIRSVFLRVWLMAGLLMLGLLIALSLRYPLALVKWFPGGEWTYVGEIRYFGPIMLLISALLLVLIGSRRSPPYPRLVAGAVLGVSLLNALFLRAQDAHQAMRYALLPAAFFVDKYENSIADAQKFARQVEAARHRGSVLLAADAYALRLHDAIVLRAGAVIPLDTLLAHQPLRTTQPVTIFIALNRNVSPAVAALLRQYQAPPAQFLPGLKVYLTAIQLPASAQITR